MENIIAHVFLLCIAAVVCSQSLPVGSMLSGLERYQEVYNVPALPYSYDAMEPWIDQKTMQMHHKQVHEERAFQMNQILKAWRASGQTPEIAKLPLFDILKNLDKVPAKWREQLRNNIGGYLNHIFFFATLTPNPSGEERNMSDVMKGAIMRSFVNVTNFRKVFNQTASAVFSSGYVWLIRVPEKRYFTIFTALQETNPLTVGVQPILGIDLWEHCYWTKYGNNREEYIRNWWKLVDFDKVEELLNWWWSFDPYDPVHHDF